MDTQTQQYDVILHIGAPKTGSSAIQHFCLNNRQLLADNGYYYPEHNSDVNGVSGGHSKLGVNIIQKKYDQARVDFNQYLDDAKSQGKVLLISAESLYAHPKVVRELTEACRCRVISFFRDPAEFIVSIYNQSVKRHYNTSTMETFCKRVLSTEQNQASGVIVYEWVKAFGKEAVSVLRYQKPQAADAKLEKQFLAVLGIPLKEQNSFIFPDKPINRSYADSVLEFKRRLNFVLDKDSKALNHKVDHALQYLSDQLAGDAINSSASQLVKSTYDMLNEKFRESNERVMTDFFAGEFVGVESSLLLEDDAPGYSLADFAVFSENIKQYDSEVDHYIKQSIWNKLNGGSVNYYVLSLADIYRLPLDGLNLSSSGKQSPSVINNSLVKQFVDQSDHHGLLLEAIAGMLEKLGKLRPALALIRKAHQFDGESQSISRSLNRIRKKTDVLSK